MMTSTAPSPSRNLGDLLSGFASVSMDLALKPVDSLALDSRNVVPGSLFFGVDGHNCRGQDFAREALNAGAVAAVVEGAGGFKRMSEGYCFQIENLKKKIGPIASRFFGHPSHTLCVIGVTGTNGKTSCSTLLAQALNLLGTRAAVIGTAGWGFPGDLAPSGLTTPDPITLQSQFHSLAERGAQSVCLEVSSHALDQGRIEGTRFDTAAFTNLSHDHLDYHKTMEAYEQTKLLLFQQKELKRAVINIADPAGKRFASSGMLCEVLTFGRDERADVYPLSERITDRGLSLTIATPKGEVTFSSPLKGSFNVENLTAVISMLIAKGFDVTRINEVMPKLTPVPGRLIVCRVASSNQPMVAIDYAHSPGALEALLVSARQMANGKLWCVFGCGGERDRLKRPEMGRLASALADHVVLTNDNPRGERPESILAQIRAGMSRPPDAEILERREAIAYAIREARQGDLIVIAGKGHESHQVIGDQVLPFDDQSVAEAILGARPC